MQVIIRSTECTNGRHAVRRWMSVRGCVRHAARMAMACWMTGRRLAANRHSASCCCCWLVEEDEVQGTVHRTDVMLDML
jgi:hypothetical protein